VIHSRGKFASKFLKNYVKVAGLVIEMMKVDFQKEMKNSIMIYIVKFACKSKKSRKRIICDPQ